MSEETAITQPKKIVNYPGNSHKVRDSSATPEREKKVEKVISGNVVQRKKGLGKKIAETFSGDDMNSVGSYVLFEVLLPAAKNMFFDAVTQGFERAIFGESKRRISTGTRVGGYTAYNRMSAPGSYSGGSMARNESRSISPRARAVHDFDEVVLATRGEAEDVLDSLGNIIEEYGVATVVDLYDLVGITGSFTDEKWGWSDLRGATVNHIRDGYLLNLPKTQPID